MENIEKELNAKFNIKTHHLSDEVIAQVENFNPWFNGDNTPIEPLSLVKLCTGHGFNDKSFLKYIRQFNFRMNVKSRSEAKISISRFIDSDKFIISNIIKDKNCYSAILHFLLFVYVYDGIIVPPVEDVNLFEVFQGSNALGLFIDVEHYYREGVKCWSRFTFKKIVAEGEKLTSDEVVNMILDSVDGVCKE